MKYTEIMIFIRRDDDVVAKNLVLYINADKTEALYKNHNDEKHSTHLDKKYPIQHPSTLNELLNNTHSYFRRIS